MVIRPNANESIRIGASIRSYTATKESLRRRANLRFGAEVSCRDVVGASPGQQGRAADACEKLKPALAAITDGHGGAEVLAARAPLESLADPAIDGASLDEPVCAHTVLAGKVAKKALTLPSKGV
jgi:hypothetical protein